MASRFQAIGNIARVAHLTGMAMLIAFLLLPAYRLAVLLCGDRGQRMSGKVLRHMLIHLGPVFIKAGQMLSTRLDLLPPSFLAPLATLQDRVPPMPPSQLRAFAHMARRDLASIGGLIEETPIASGSIAQVHRIQMQGGARSLVIKIKRPGIAREIARDTRILLKLADMLQALPIFSSIPVISGMRQICAALLQQADFHQEALAQSEFHERWGAAIRIPLLLAAACNDDYLVMEYIPDMRKLADVTLSSHERRSTVLAMLRVLYDMIFSAGLIHCDLHPGNLHATRSGELVLLDFGCWARFPEAARRDFAEFFFCVAINDGPGGARVICASALRVPADLDPEAFEQDIVLLFQNHSRLRASEFLVSKFVTALFQIQQRHRIVATSAFTMAILSLVMFEGIARPLHPDLDFQREAMPFVMQALQ